MNAQAEDRSWLPVTQDFSAVQQHTMSYLNPKFKPTTTTTKACATYESVKIATLEEKK
jgi:hypothetical protein